MIQVYSLKLVRELNEEERQQALDIITPERKAKALRFRRFEDQTRGIAAGLLEAYALWKSFGLSRDKQNIQKGEQGKPYLPEQRNAYYNLSHAGKWLVCGTGDCPLGIDVEQAEKYQEKLVKRFFHQKETLDILKHTEAERPGIFAEYWTMKESFMKLCGTGFSMPLSSFLTNRENQTVSLLPTMEQGLKQQLRRQGISEETKTCCKRVELEQGYCCMVCTKEPEEIKLEPLSMEQCLAELSGSDYRNPPSKRRI